MSVENVASASSEKSDRELSSPRLDEAWFAEPAPSTKRRSSSPPPPSVKLGEFLGDELADSWLR